jgi:lipoate-protein ligase A
MAMADSLFFQHHAADPHFNMAFDESMFAYALDHAGAVLLRLYTWQPGAITFGFNQREDTALDFTQLGDTPVIRRVTGGRAVYHDVSELTYSVAINPHTPERAVLGGTTSAIYRKLSAAIMSFLERLGVPSELVEKSSPENSRPEFFHKAPCFASSARYEIVTAGRKIVASAQKQIRGVILQHGSMKVSGLVAHAALDATAPQTGATFQPVDKEWFDRAAQLFSGVFERALELELERAEGLPAMTSELEERVCEVAKNALARRNIFKQTSSSNSL